MPKCAHALPYVRISTELMSFEDQLNQMAQLMAESQRRSEEFQRRWEERHEKLQQQLHNLAATVSEDHWRFQEDMRALTDKQQRLQNLSEAFQEDLRTQNGKHKALESLVFQIAEGTARLLNSVAAHERRLEDIEGQDQP